MQYSNGAAMVGWVVDSAGRRGIAGDVRVAVCSLTTLVEHGIDPGQAWQHTPSSGAQEGEK